MVKKKIVIKSNKAFYDIVKRRKQCCEYFIKWMQDNDDVIVSDETCDVKKGLSYTSTMYHMVVVLKEKSQKAKFTSVWPYSFGALVWLTDLSMEQSHFIVTFHIHNVSETS